MNCGMQISKSRKERYFEFILDKFQPEICRKSTPMRDSVITKRRLAIMNFVESNLNRQTTVSPCFIVIFSRRMRVRN